MREMKEYATVSFMREGTLQSSSILLFDASRWAPDPATRQMIDYLVTLTDETSSNSQALSRPRCECGHSNIVVVGDEK